MTIEQFEALTQYIRAVAAREAAFATFGHTEGGFDKDVDTKERELRQLLVKVPQC